MRSISFYIQLSMLLIRLSWHMASFAATIGLSYINKHKTIQVGSLLAGSLILLASSQIWIEKQSPRLELVTTETKVNSEISKSAYVRKITEQELEQLIEQHQATEKTGVISRNLYFNLSALHQAKQDLVLDQEYLNKTLEIEPKLAN